MLLHYLGKLKTICTDICLETLSTLQWTSGESVSRHVFVQMINILNTFCEQTHANNLHFHVLLFLVQVASAHSVRFLLRWCLMVNRPIPYLTACEALSLLRTVNEQKVKCRYLHGVNLCTYFRDIWDVWWIDDKKLSNICNMFYVHGKCKISNF